MPEKLPDAVNKMVYLCPGDIETVTEAMRQSGSKSFSNTLRCIIREWLKMVGSGEKWRPVSGEGYGSTQKKMAYLQPIDMEIVDTSRFMLGSSNFSYKLRTIIREWKELKKSTGLYLVGGDQKLHRVTPVNYFVDDQGKNMVRVQDMENMDVVVVKVEELCIAGVDYALNS